MVTFADSLTLFGFLCISALFSAGEFAFLPVRRGDTLAADDKRRRTLVRLLSRPRDLMVNLFVGTAISNAFSVLFALRIAARSFPSEPDRTIASVVFLVIVAVLMTIMARLLPKIYVAHNPEAAALNLAQPVFVLFVPLYPFRKIVLLLTQGLFAAGTQADDLLARATLEDETESSGECTRPKL